MSENSVYFIDSAALNRILQEKSALLVDVRQPEEFAGGTVPGAINIPLGDLDMSSLIDQTDEMDCDIVFICAIGQRSFGAANAALPHLDCKVMTLKGGVQSWARDGFAVQK
ncbi:rhodanese-like domain-containing protein [Thalassospira marina]|uniref:Sulfurtransferase n=1 Tax=Thalassospira marina TaxID=2048283 RepID=A0A2N3L073_9PROT|nr:rhodanese-like domain-containing protein [Thalassospira marina]PKR56188.1 sulfurtransferase [Thalassospira marina]